MVCESNPSSTYYKERENETLAEIITASRAFEFNPHNFRFAARRLFQKHEDPRRFAARVPFN
jgi:hypothetical protein